MDFRTESFVKKFESAGHELGVQPHEVVSLKIRENVSSYAEYQEFLHVLEREAGVKWSAIDGELQGKGYLLSDSGSRVLVVEHETGLEILYIAGSIASLLSLVPLVMQGWRAFRGRHFGRHDFEDRAIEVRRLDDRGQLSEERLHDPPSFAPLPFSVNNALASAARTLERDLRGLLDQVRALSTRVDLLEERIPTKSKMRKVLKRKGGLRSPKKAK